MRCDECKVEPVTPGHFCECCGRKLSLQERKLSTRRNPSTRRKRTAQTSWGEPAPVLPKASKGDRLVGNDFTPEPYVDEPDAGRRSGGRRHTRRGFDAARPEPNGSRNRARDNRSDSRGALWRAPVEAAPDPQVSAPPAVEPVVEPPVAADVPAAHLDSLVSAARCESCGGPAEAGDLCSRCQHAFHSLLECAARVRSDRGGCTAGAASRRRAGGRAYGERRPAEPEVAPVVSPVPAEPAQTVIAVRAPVAPEVPVVEAAPAAQGRRNRWRPHLRCPNPSPRPWRLRR